MTIFHKVLSTIQKNALETVSLFAVVFGVSIWGLSFSKLELDIYDVFDPSFQSSVDNTEIKQDFNDQSQVLVTFKFPGRTAGLAPAPR